MNAAAKIKRPRKADRIASDLLDHIRTGQLQPGERLAGMTRLRKLYHASQRVVEAALKQLESQGLITIQPRSGSYVADDAPAHVPGAAAPGLPAATPGLDYFTRPQSSQDVLTVYLTELYPENLTIWREELDALRPQLDVERIDILTCADGHAQEVLRDRSVDVALITPAVMQAIGPEQFVELTDPTAFGVNVDECLRPVQEMLRQGTGFGGVPFSVILNVLFINRDLARETGVADHPINTVQDLLAAAGQAEAKLSARGAAAMRGTGHLHDLLITAGALRCSEQGAFVLDDDTAEDVFSRLADAGIKAGRDDDISRFARGALLYLSHCSYQAVEFARTCDSDWAVHAAPVSAGTMRPAELTFLTINRETAALGKALDLVKHMLSETVQKRFGAVNGNLPILSAALTDDILNQHPMGREALLEQLRSTTLLWPVGSLSASGWRLGLRDTERALLSGRISPEEAVARLRLQVQCCNEQMQGGAS